MVAPPKHWGPGWRATWHAARAARWALGLLARWALLPALRALAWFFLPAPKVQPCAVCGADVEHRSRLLPWPSSLALRTARRHDAPCGAVCANGGLPPAALDAPPAPPGPEAVAALRAALRGMHGGRALTCPRCGELPVPAWYDAQARAWNAEARAEVAAERAAEPVSDGPAGGA